jgi:hypothetical protein
MVKEYNIIIHKAKYWLKKFGLLPIIWCGSKYSKSHAPASHNGLTFQVTLGKHCFPES